MARRKKRTMKRKTSRRRIGAVGKGNIMDLVAVVGGAVIGRYVAKKLLPNVDERIKNAGVLALGIFLPKFIKSSTGKSLGTGMVAAGGIGLVGTVLTAIAGTDDTIDFPMEIGEVEDGISVIAGDDVMAGDDLQVLAGMHEDDDDDSYYN